ncbi:AAC(3) family N-acetyltransferase [Chitinivorax sp. B]|uniref:AAC(3) family N-acetyltransferase n=1 Tax=Chitinivorax sp. B TaxID=2502235 RepID=UPI0014856AA7|nr:AAC(3) family N-acetyltransferase [Chitinivorax sp. B]
MANLLQSLKQAVKGVLEARYAKRREAEIKAEAPHITKTMIVDGLRDMGIGPGDVVMLHSSLKSLGYVDGGAQTVLEAVYEAVSPGGTLVVPTYYLPGGTIYNTCQMTDYVFDPREHGSNLGALPDTFLKMPGIRRSIHPTHSVSALGPQADYIVSSHHLAPSIFGEGSPWERCLQVNAKVLGLGITMGPVTFYHLLEDKWLDRFPLPVRLPEVFQLKCRDWEGRLIEVPVTPLDPVYNPRRIDNKARGDLQQFFMDDFRRAGILKDGKVGQAAAWFVNAQDFYGRLEWLAERGITIYAEPEKIAKPVSE